MDVQDRLEHMLHRLRLDGDMLLKLLGSGNFAFIQLVEKDGRWLPFYATEGVHLLGLDADTLIRRRYALDRWFDENSWHRVKRFLDSGEAEAHLEVTLWERNGRNILVKAHMVRHVCEKTGRALLLILLEDLRSQVQLQRIFEMFARGPVVLFEWSGETGWPIQYVSPNVEAELNLPYEVLLSGQKAFADFVHPDDLVRVKQEVAAYLNDKTEDFVQEYRLLDQSGKVHWVRDYTHMVLFWISRIKSKPSWHWKKKSGWLRGMRCMIR